jgi:predicted enzyme related to lactoylglutathione lyase
MQFIRNQAQKESPMFTPKGKFGWYELMTSDTKAAGKFYSAVVGWTVHEMAGPDGVPSYNTFNIGETGIAGMLTLPGPTAWVGYIHVDDLEAHIEKIVEAGGKLLRPVHNIPGMLRFAVMADPQGAAFVGFTSDPAMPSPQRPEPPAVGTVSWHELYTTDLEAGFDFYNKLFGWTKNHDMDMGPHGVYRIFDQGDNKPMGDGGIMRKGDHIPVPCWNFYFQVDAINAAVERVKAGGGKVLNGPMQVPGGGWVIQGMDPQGAMFSLVSSNE